MAQFSRAVDELIQQRWILTIDREELLRRGAAEWDAYTQ
jgi:hypothetical protein